MTVPFTPGRMDASQEQTDIESFALLEPVADGFRNYLRGKYTVSAEALLVDKAQLLTDQPEMTGARGRPARPENELRRGNCTASSPIGPEALTNDFFVNLLDIGHRVEAALAGRATV